MSRKIVYAKLHGTEAFVPGLGGLTTTLPPANKTIPNFDMTATETGILLKASDSKGTLYEALIPWANVQICRFAPEEKKEAKDKK